MGDSLMNQVMPRQPVPALDLPLAGGGRFVLADEQPESFTLLLFYRGLHCPICKGQLDDLQNRLDEFGEAGIRCVAISMDGQERAEKAKHRWDLAQLDIAYDLAEETARKFGLYISSPVSDKEPERFCEPGMFVVQPDGTLYCSIVQTMPFTRPSLADLLPGLKYAISNGYPARGEVE
jgi:peroxiredoxin